MDIILASGSPRRHELLTRAQLDFRVISVDIDESPYPNEPPIEYIERMVAAKAHAAIRQLAIDYRQGVTTHCPLSDPFIILTADTIGVLPDGKTVLVKPIDREHAYSMWQHMSANTHQVWTAVQATQVSIVSTSAEKPNATSHTDIIDIQCISQQHIIECTDVTFVPLTPDMMREYWNSGEPADKAGGYGIQGLAAAWVTHIQGSYTNVVGLPLAQTLALIDKMTTSVETKR